MPRIAIVLGTKAAEKEINADHVFRGGLCTTDSGCQGTGFSLTFNASGIADYF